MSLVVDDAYMGYAEIILSLRVEKRPHPVVSNSPQRKRVRLSPESRAPSEASSDTLCDFEQQRAESSDLEDDGPPFRDPLSLNRTFPPEIPIRMDDFKLFYRRFPASTYFQPHDDVELKREIAKPGPSGGIYNAPRGAFDLYRPRFTKGCGSTKQGVCPICIEQVERGGMGKTLWLATKYSALNYHLQFAHGISPVTGRPFSPPIAFRVVDRVRSRIREKSEMKEGQCHHCSKWVSLEGVKEGDVKVKEIFWWKHAAKCHRGSTIKGETDIFIKDATYHRLLQYTPKVVTEDSSPSTDVEDTAVAAAKEVKLEPEP